MAQDYWRGGWANQQQELPGTRAARIDGGYSPLHALADIVGALNQRNRDRATQQALAEYYKEVNVPTDNVISTPQFQGMDNALGNYNPQPFNKDTVAQNAVPIGNGFGSDQWYQNRQAQEQRQQQAPPQMGQPPQSVQMPEGNIPIMYSQAQPTAQPTAYQQPQSTDRFVNIAQQVSAQTGIPPELIYGQMVRETGWFQHDRANANNNFAGLWGGADGKSYANDQEFINDYAKILNQDNFAEARQAKTPEEFAAALSRGGYFEDSNVAGYGQTIRDAFDQFQEKGGVIGGQPQSQNTNVAEYQRQMQEHPEWFDLDGNYMGNVYGMYEDSVSDSNIDKLTARKFNLLARDFKNKWGEDLRATSLRRHGDGSSWHDSGQAGDFAGGILETSPEARAWLMERGKQYGLAGLDEYANPSPHATGGHIHFSDHGDELQNNYTVQQLQQPQPAQQQQAPPQQINLPQGQGYAPPERNLHQATAAEPWTDRYNSKSEVLGKFDEAWAQKMKVITDKAPWLLQDANFMREAMARRQESRQELLGEWDKTEQARKWEQFARAGSNQEKMFYAVQNGLDLNAAKLLAAPEWNNELKNFGGENKIISQNRYTGEILVNGRQPTDRDLAFSMSPTERDASARGWANYDLNVAQQNEQKRHNLAQEANTRTAAEAKATSKSATATGKAAGKWSKEQIDQAKYIAKQFEDTVKQYTDSITGQLKINGEPAKLSDLPGYKEYMDAQMVLKDYSNEMYGDFVKSNRPKPDMATLQSQISAEIGNGADIGDVKQGLIEDYGYTPEEADNIIAQLQAGKEEEKPKGKRINPAEIANDVVEGRIKLPGVFGAINQLGRIAR